MTHSWGGGREGEDINSQSFFMQWDTSLAKFNMRPRIVFKILMLSYLNVLNFTYL